MVTDDDIPLICLKRKWTLENRFSPHSKCVDSDDISDSDIAEDHSLDCDDHQVYVDVNVNDCGEGGGGY